MPRRKKTFGFNQFIVIVVIIVGIWITADYYFNVYQHSSKGAPEQESAPIVTQPAAPVTVTDEEEPALEDGFRLETYRDENGKFEFQYPVYAQPDPACPSIKKNGNGFDLGMFSFTANEGQGTISDFIDSELQGMEINKKENITVAGLAATRIDYQTQGMGWNGSLVFVGRDGKFYEFGILANTTAEKCGGVDDYADRVYRSVTSTLKFTD